MMAKARDQWYATKACCDSDCPTLTYCSTMFTREREPLCTASKGREKEPLFYLCDCCY